MLAFPEMIAPAAEEADIKVPPDLENYSREDYPHWAAFCNVQLGAPMPHASAHWENAKVIATIPHSEIKLTTYQQLLDKGLAVGFSK